MVVIYVVIYSVIALYYGILAAIAFGMYRSGKVKAWARLALLSGLLLVTAIPGLMVRVLPGSTLFNDLKFTHGLTGKLFLIGTPTLSYDSEASFNGDGYSIGVWTISQSASDAFQSPHPTFFTAYPKRPWYRKGWNTQSWRPTPFHATDAALVEFALSEWETTPQLQAALEKARQALEQPGSYYGLHYKYSKQNPANIDLFILSPDLKQLILINFNT